MDDAPQPSSIDGLLLTRDLMFTSKVTGTAAMLGLRIEVLGSIDSLQSHMSTTPPRAVFLDLSCADFVPKDVIDRLTISPRPVVIAFGSHVDVARLEAARQACCDEVMPRSAFSATLPSLLQQACKPTA